MVTNHLFFIFFLIITGCTNPKAGGEISKDFLIGSWASCYEDDLYVELHFSRDNNYAFHVYDDVLDYNVGKYIICSNKIHISIQEKNLTCEQEDVSQMAIVFKSNDEFENVEKGRKYTFRRLSGQPIMDYQLGTKVLEQQGYMNEFILRRDTFNCSKIITE